MSSIAVLNNLIGLRLFRKMFSVFPFIFVKDMGTVVLGKLESGSICKGQQLVMMPNKVW